MKRFERAALGLLRSKHIVSQTFSKKQIPYLSAQVLR